MYVKEVFGAISAFVSFASFIPYAHTMLRGHTRPHLFTWLVWSILTTIIFIIQYQGGAGPAAWGSGVIALTSACIMLYSIFRGEREGSLFDWATFLISLLCIPLWLLTNDPTLAAIFVTAIDVLAFWPTVSKSWRHPRSENLLYYIAWLVKYPAAFLAIESMSLANAIYPVTWSIIGIGFVILLVARREYASTQEVRS